MKITMLTSEQLKNLLKYDMETGVFTYKITRGKCIHGSIAGTKHSHGYWQIRVDGKIYLAHRLAWLYVYGEWPYKALDHKNRNKLDNRINNLRESDQSHNIANSNLSSVNTSGYKGVCWDKRTKSWLVSIRKNRKRIHIGRFKDLTIGHFAYARIAKQLFGEFSNP